jgi:hypothetical protein
MILGLILVLIGGLLLAKNRSLAMMWGHEYHAHQVTFSNSIARQNITIVGAVLVAGGVGLILLV